MTFKLEVQFGSETKIICKDNVSRQDFILIDRVDEIPINECILPMTLPVPSHPFLEYTAHVL